MKLVVCIFMLNIVLLAQPVWIDDPSMNGKYIGAVGYAPKEENKHIQEQKALLQAKASISHEEELTITDTTEVSMDEFGEEDASFSSEIESDTVLLTKEKDRYIDTEGNLYIWLIQTKGVVDEENSFR